MQELIKVTLNQKQQQVVSARELHQYLGFNKTQISRWVKSQILNNKYFEENTDYVRLDTDVVGVYDYALTLDMSKKICMVSSSKKGNEIRNYFIECEKQLKNPNVPQTYAAALLEAGRLALELETAQVKLLEANRTVSILTHVSKQYTATEIAKELGFNSAIELNKLLHIKQIQFNQSGTWVLYSKYSNLGYVDIKQEILDNGKVIYHRRWTQTGREFLVKLLSK
jgi:phage anti-repressor protein